MENPYVMLLEELKEIKAQNAEILRRTEERQPKPTDSIRVIDVAFKGHVSERTILRRCDDLKIKVSNNDPYDARYNTVEYQHVAKLIGFKARKAS